VSKNGAHGNRSLRSRVIPFAERIELKCNWNNLVVSAERLGQLRGISNFVRTNVEAQKGAFEFKKLSRGRGLVVLFTGQDGAAKKMAAEVIAKETGFAAFRINLSAVVSKFIGETEKNLNKIFDAAEESGAVLFFDEADALFGNRSEVKDSHDRYANAEVDYLLQRIESYDGLVILAANRKLEDSFLRRMRWIVDFPAPNKKSVFNRKN
jgi:SpoVK/Ycf46/Vps4 family AAA+-type ATPase